MSDINTLNNTASASRQMNIQNIQHSMASEVHHKTDVISHKRWDEMNVVQRFFCWIFDGFTGEKRLNKVQQTEIAQVLTCLQQETPQGNEIQRFSASFPDGSSLRLFSVRDGSETSVHLLSRDSASDKEISQIFKGAEANRILKHLPVIIGKDQQDSFTSQMKLFSHNSLDESHYLWNQKTIIHTVPRDIDIQNMITLASNMPTLEIERPDSRTTQLFNTIFKDFYRFSMNQGQQVSFCGVKIPYEFMTTLFANIQQAGIKFDTTTADPAQIQSVFRQTCNQCPLRPEHVNQLLTQDSTAQAAFLASMSQSLQVAADEGSTIYRGTENHLCDMPSNKEMIKTRQPLGNYTHTPDGTEVNETRAIESLRKYDIRPASDGGYTISSSYIVPRVQHDDEQQIYIVVTRAEAHIPQGTTLLNLNSEQNIRDSLIESTAIVAYDDQQ